MSKTVTTQGREARMLQIHCVFSIKMVVQRSGHSRSILIGKSHMRTPLQACGANVANKCYKHIVFFHPSFIRSGGFWSRFGGQTASRHWKFCGRQSDSLKLDYRPTPKNLQILWCRNLVRKSYKTKHLETL